MRVHFTDISIRKFKPGSYWDDSTPGFGVRVGKHAKTWTINVPVACGGRRRAAPCAAAQNSRAEIGARPASVRLRNDRL